MPLRKPVRSITSRSRSISPGVLKRPQHLGRVDQRLDEVEVLERPEREGFRPCGAPSDVLYSTTTGSGGNRPATARSDAKNAQNNAGSGLMTGRISSEASSQMRTRARRNAPSGALGREGPP